MHAGNSNTMFDSYSPTKCDPPNVRELSPKPQFQDVLNLHLAEVKARNSLTLFFMNSTLFSIIIFDLLYEVVVYKPIYYAEWVLVSIFFINSLYYIINYTKAIFMKKPILMNQKNKSLISSAQSDSGFFKNKNFSPISSSLPTSFNISSINFRSFSNTLENSAFIEDDFSGLNLLNRSNHQTTCRTKTSPNASQIKKSFNNSIINNSFTDSNNFIQDEIALKKYLTEISKTEKKSTHLPSNQPSNLLSSFWLHSPTANPADSVALLKKCSYQLSPTLEKSKSSSPGVEEGNSGVGQFGVLDVWTKYRIDSTKLNQWTANLRMWISQTILERVAAEIDNVSASLIRHGLSDSQPGYIGLDKLKKLAHSLSLSVIPSLPMLVPFLELCSNQDYLVQRIKILAKGGSMSEFKWNSGGLHNGKEWDPSLPTDTAIVMHLITTYMDTQLEALFNLPEGRPFTSMYTAKSKFELPTNKGPIILNQSINPPHYCLAHSSDSLSHSYEEIPKGRNNLFHTWLLFLFITKTRDHGMLGRVNLGMSGINILWVID